MEKNVEITVYSNKGEFEVGKKLTRIETVALKNRRYRKVVELLRRVREDEVIDSVKVEFYNKIK